MEERKKKLKKAGTNVLIVDWVWPMAMTLTQLYAFNQMNSLKGIVQNTEAKWNSKLPIFYIWLLCHVFCFVLCVGVCARGSSLFTMKLDCEDEGCVLEMVCGKLAPCHVTESYLATSQVLTWKHALRSLPGFSPMISLSGNEEEKGRAIAEHKVSSAHQHWLQH